MSHAERRAEFAGDESDPRPRRGAPAPVATWAPARLDGDRAFASLALGLLAMAPLFCAYEYGLREDAGLFRSQSEQALFRILALAPGLETLLRRCVLGLGLVGALVLCYRRRIALGPSLLRIFLEGVCGAIALGPALAYGMRFLGGFENEVAPVAADTSLPVAARVFGAAAFEELLFRVALYGILFVLTRRVALFFGLRERISLWTAEVVAVLCTSLGFAAIHLTSCSGWIAPQGEPLDTGIFVWRFLAGLLLALLFRWRGPGVAAWSHGLFNLALLIGAGPEVLL
jgi:membrane protease YdiL (CAAX protease family)